MMGLELPVNASLSRVSATLHSLGFETVGKSPRHVSFALYLPETPAAYETDPLAFPEPRYRNDKLITLPNRPHVPKPIFQRLAVMLSDLDFVAAYYRTGWNG